MAFAVTHNMGCQKEGVARVWKIADTSQRPSVDGQVFQNFNVLFAMIDSGGRTGPRGPFFPGTPFTSQSDVRTGEGFRTGRTESDGSDEVGEEDGFFFRRRGGHGAPRITVKRIAEPALELSGPVALPDGAGTAFYFLRGQHAAKLERNGRVRAPVSIIDKKPPGEWPGG